MNDCITWGEVFESDTHKMAKNYALYLQCEGIPTRLIRETRKYKGRKYLLFVIYVPERYLEQRKGS